MKGVDQFAFPGAVGFTAFIQALAQVNRLQCFGVFAGRCCGAIGAVADNLAVAHLNDPIGPRRDLAVVGNQNHHMALAGQLIEQRHDFCAAVAVERTGGFVGQDDVPAVHQRAGNRYALLLTAGELMRTVAGACAKAQAVEQRGSAGMPLGRWRTGVNGGHFDVFLGRGRGDQMVALKHKAERLAAQPGELIAGEVGNVFACKQVAP